MSTWKSFRPDGIPHPFALSITNEEVMFVSGLGGHDAEGNIAESPLEQAREALRTMQAQLEREGFSLDNIVWFHPYTTDISYAFEMDEALREAFGENPPACGAMLAGVQLADPRMKIEFEAVAVKGATRVRVQ
ncbi:MAG: RidA family protein [Leucobacter sp.]|nr:RidA family protein [Leucobacter sp.]